MSIINVKIEIEEAETIELGVSSAEKLMPEHVRDSFRAFCRESNCDGTGGWWKLGYNGVTWSAMDHYWD